MLSAFSYAPLNENMDNTTLPPQMGLHLLWSLVLLADITNLHRTTNIN